jgi:hypothetical protein
MVRRNRIFAKIRREMAQRKSTTARPPATRLAQVSFPNESAWRATHASLNSQEFRSSLADSFFSYHDHEERETF